MPGALTAVKSILVFGAWVIRNLDPSPTVVGIFKKVHIGALVEAVMARALCFWTVEVVNVPKTCSKKELSVRRRSGSEGLI